jgi:hypothetical protein
MFARQSATDGHVWSDLRGEDTVRNEARARLMIRLLLVPAALIALMLVAPAVTSAGLDLIT